MVTLALCARHREATLRPIPDVPPMMRMDLPASFSLYGVMAAMVINEADIEHFIRVAAS